MFAKLATRLPHCLGLSYWHYQLVSGHGHFSAKIKVSATSPMCVSTGGHNNMMSKFSFACFDRIFAAGTRFCLVLSQFRADYGTGADFHIFTEFQISYFRCKALTQDNMNYPSLSLRQELIDKVLSGAKYGTQRQMQETPSPEAIRMKKLRKRQKESRMQNAVVVEECDQCEFKSSQFKAVYRHRREKHLVPKQKCTDCGYSNIYPNRVKTHFNRVHRGMKRKPYEKCRRESCAYAGTTDCSELQIHSQFFCKQ